MGREGIILNLIFRKGRSIMVFQMRGVAGVGVWKQEYARHGQGTVDLEHGVLVEGQLEKRLKR